MQYDIELKKPISFSTSEIDKKSQFGAPRGKKGGGIRDHAGIDIYRDRGTSVSASFGGTVVRASGPNEHETYGALVIIDHTLDQEDEEKSKSRPYVDTLYAHLDSVETIRGRNASQGETIGTVGNTGNARKMKPHLHFEVIKAPRKLVWHSTGATWIEAGSHRIDPLSVF